MWVVLHQNLRRTQVIFRLLKPFFNFIQPGLLSPLDSPNNFMLFKKMGVKTEKSALCLALEGHAFFLLTPLFTFKNRYYIINKYPRKTLF